MQKTGLENGKRPIIPIPRSGFEKAVEALAILGVLMSFYLLIASYSDLPEKIPMHYGFGGKPDAYGGKWTIVALPVIGLALYAGMSLIRKIPHYYNYPWPITKENAPEMYRISIVMITCVKMEVVWLFTYIQWMTVRVGMGKSQGLGALLLPVTFVVLAVTVIVAVFQMRRVK